MKILLIHGENFQDSYKRLIAIKAMAKKKDWQIIPLKDGSDINKIFSSSLFGNKNLYIIEDINKFNSRDLKWLIKNKNKVSKNLIIYDKELVSKSTIKILNHGLKIEEYKIPKIIYKFLESFTPNLYKSCLDYLQQLLKNQSAEYIFAILARHLRDLYWAKTDSSSLPYPYWRVTRLKNQSAKFKFTKLKKILNMMESIDKQSKTSKTDLTEALNLLILTAFTKIPIKSGMTCQRRQD